MGYTTDFTGEFMLDKPLTPEHKAYLEAFAGTRRMKRNAKKTSKMKDPLREKVGLPIGPEGAYFVGATLLEDGDWQNGSGQARTPDITDYNCAPEGQPGLWCQWVPNEDGTAIIWDEGEKFYSYVSWIKYLIKNFLEPWGYILNGDVEWVGEDPDDRGRIEIKDNEVSVYHGEITYTLAAGPDENYSD